MTEVVLSDYQENAVYRLLNGGIETHGIMLWWMMGTGKTFAGVAMMLNYPDKHVNIICPDELIFVWKKELGRVNKIKNKINFYNFKTFLNRSSFKDEIVIVDEAHHIITDVINVNDGESSSDALKTVNLFNTSYKIMLLTGTPIYTDFTNLVYLTNITAGKEVLPYNPQDFKNKYHRTRKIKSAFKGYYTEISDLIMKIMSMITMLFIVFLAIIYLFYPEKGIDWIIKKSTGLNETGKKMYDERNKNDEVNLSMENLLFKKGIEAMKIKVATTTDEEKAYIISSMEKTKKEEDEVYKKHGATEPFSGINIHDWMDKRRMAQEEIQKNKMMSTFYKATPLRIPLNII